MIIISNNNNHNGSATLAINIVWLYRVQLVSYSVNNVQRSCAKDFQGAMQQVSYS